MIFGLGIEKKTRRGEERLYDLEKFEGGQYTHSNSTLFNVLTLAQLIMGYTLRSHHPIGRFRPQSSLNAAAVVKFPTQHFVSTTFSEMLLSVTKTILDMLLPDPKKRQKTIFSLPNAKPPLNSPSSNTILSHVIPRIFNILLPPLLGLPLPHEPVLFPLLHLLGLLQSLLLVLLRRLCHVHLVNFDKSRCGLEGVV